MHFNLKNPFILFLCILIPGPLLYSQGSGQSARNTAPPVNFKSLQWERLVDGKWGVPVAGDRLNVRARPDINSTVKGQLGIGEWVQITDRNPKTTIINGDEGRWTRITSHEQELEGWVFDYFLGTKSRMKPSEEWDYTSLFYFNHTDGTFVQYGIAAPWPYIYGGDLWQDKERLKDWSGNYLFYRNLRMFETEEKKVEMVFFHPDGFPYSFARRGIRHFAEQLYTYENSLDEAEVKTHQTFLSLFPKLPQQDIYTFQPPENNTACPSFLREGFYIPLPLKDFFPKKFHTEKPYWVDIDEAPLESFRAGVYRRNMGPKAHNQIRINSTYTGYIISHWWEYDGNSKMSYNLWLWNHKTNEMEIEIQLSELGAGTFSKSKGEIQVMAWLTDVNGDGSLDVIRRKKGYSIPKDETSGNWNPASKFDAFESIIITNSGYQIYDTFKGKNTSGYNFESTIKVPD